MRAFSEPDTVALFQFSPTSSLARTLFTGLLVYRGMSLLVYRGYAVHWPLSVQRDVHSNCTEGTLFTGLLMYRGYAVPGLLVYRGMFTLNAQRVRCSLAS